MKRKNSVRIFSILVMIAAGMIPFLAMAQTNPGDNPDAPIDGGLSLLLAAGVGYGVKKYRDERNKKSSTKE